MNIISNAQMSANEATHQFLISEAALAVIGTDKAVMDKVAQFEINRKASIISAAAAGINNTGFSQDKLDAKELMSFMASCLAGTAQVKLDELGKNSISRQIHEADSYYLYAADSEASTEAQALHDLLLTNIELFTPDYISAADLISFQGLISGFSNIQGSSAAVHRISPELTLAFKTDLNATKKNGTDIKKLIKKYKKTNSVFYRSMVDVMKPKITIHHTNLSLLIVEAKTNIPVNDAVATFSDSAKTGVSIEDGSMLIEEIGNGDKTMTITSDRYKDSITNINILSGRTNSFKIELNPKI